MLMGLSNILNAMWASSEQECEDLRGENNMLKIENERLRKAYLEPMAAELVALKRETK